MRLKSQGFHLRFVPGEVAGVTPGHAAVLAEGEEMEPAIVEQCPDVRVALEDAGDRLLRGLDDDGEPQRFMRQLITVMDGLPGQAGAQEAAIAFDDADSPCDVVQELVAGAEDFRRDG